MVGSSGRTGLSSQYVLTECIKASKIPNNGVNISSTTATATQTRFTPTFC
jgi:hypothetical protein